MKLDTVIKSVLKSRNKKVIDYTILVYHLKDKQRSTGVPTKWKCNKKTCSKMLLFVFHVTEILNKVEKFLVDNFCRHKPILQTYAPAQNNVIWFIMKICTRLQAIYKRYTKTKAWSFQNALSNCLVYQNNHMEWLLLFKLSCAMGANNKFAYHRFKTPISQGLLSLHHWHTRMKPFTDNPRKEYEFPIIDLFLSF